MICITRVTHLDLSRTFRRFHTYRPHNAPFLSPSSPRPLRAWCVAPELGHRNQVHIAIKQVLRRNTTSRSVTHLCLIAVYKLRSPCSIEGRAELLSTGDGQLARKGERPWSRAGALEGVGSVPVGVRSYDWWWLKEEAAAKVRRAFVFWFWVKILKFTVGLCMIVLCALHSSASRQQQQLDHILFSITASCFCCWRNMLSDSCFVYW